MRIKWSRGLDVRQQAIPEQPEPSQQQQSQPATTASSSSSVSDLRGKKDSHGGIFNFWRSFRKKNRSSRYAGVTDDMPLPSESSRRLTWSGADPRANRRLMQADRLLVPNDQQQQQLQPTFLSSQQITNGERTINIFQESFNQHNRSQSCSLQPITPLQAPERDENGTSSSNIAGENQAQRVASTDEGISNRQPGDVEMKSTGVQATNYLETNFSRGIYGERLSFRNKDRQVNGALLGNKKQTTSSQTDSIEIKEETRKAEKQTIASQTELFQIKEESRGATNTKHTTASQTECFKIKLEESQIAAKQTTACQTEIVQVKEEESQKATYTKFTTASQTECFKIKEEPQKVTNAKYTTASQTECFQSKEESQQTVHDNRTTASQTECAQSKESPEASDLNITPNLLLDSKSQFLPPTEVNLLQRKEASQQTVHNNHTIASQTECFQGKDEESHKSADLNIRPNLLLDDKSQSVATTEVDILKLGEFDKTIEKSDKMCAVELNAASVRYHRKESRIPVSHRLTRGIKSEVLQQLRKPETIRNEMTDYPNQDGHPSELEFIQEQVAEEVITTANGPQTPTTPVGSRNISSSGRPLPVIRSGFSSSSPLVIPSSSRQQRQKLEELWREVQHLGALCESRTKELNRVKMQLRHAASGFDAFATLVQYLAGELNAFSHPDLISEIQTTKEQLITLESFLKQCEGDLEGMRERHAEEATMLTKQLQQAQEDTALLQEKLENAEQIHLKQCEEWELEKSRVLEEAGSRQQAALEITQAQHTSQIEALSKDHEEEVKACEERHKVEQEALQGQLDLMKERCRKLQEQACSIEEALQQDTNAKIQWLSAKNADLQKEVESLKSVLEMKQDEVHNLRKENLVVNKQAEEVTVYRQRVGKLMTRIEELQALLREKSKKERKLSCDQRNLQEHLDKESKINRQLSMEKEELLWRLTESFNNSSGSLNTVLVTPEFLRKRHTNTSTPFRLAPGSLPPFHETFQDEQPSQEPSGDANLVTSTSSLDSKPHRAKVRVNRTQSCHTSPRDSPSHNSSSRMVVSTPNMPCDDDDTCVDDDASPAKLSPCDSLTELHFKACMQMDCIDDLLLQQKQQQQEIYSPNGASSPNSGSASMTSSAAEDLSLSSTEEERRMDILTASPRNRVGEALMAVDEKNREAMATPDSPLGERVAPPSDNNFSDTPPCFCDDFDISSEPE